MELRKYQADAVQALRLSMAKGNKRIILSSPTGSGKTEMGFEIIRSAQAKGTKVAFLANRISLIDQTSRRLSEAGFLHGVIQGENTAAPWRSVLVCSIQTIAKRGLPEGLGLLVIDEAHAAAGTKAYHQIMRDIPVIGLTATPYSPGLGRHIPELDGPLFQDVVTAARIKDLIRDGFLVSADIWAPGEPDLSKVKITAGDYNETELGEVVNTAELVGDIVTHWFRLAHNEATVVFATNIAHSKHICKQFQDAGVKAEHLDHWNTDDDRRAILARVSSGETKVICNVGVLAEGWDFPACKVLILARPTKSLIRYLQMAGRVLRPFTGKQRACVLAGTRILTDYGLVSIDKITLDHKIWDGVAFVPHEGAICQGVKDVISYAGITGTPDHLVRTPDGWETLQTAASGQKWIAQTGSGGKPIRFFDDCFSANRWIDMESPGSCPVPEMWEGSHGQVPQYAEEAQYSGLPALQPKATCIISILDLCSVSGRKRKMRESYESGIQELRQTGDRVPVQECERGISLGGGELGHSWGPVGPVGQDRQRGALRAGESPVVNAKSEHGAYQGPFPGNPDAPLQAGSPRSKICGFDAKTYDRVRDDLRTNRGEVPSPILQAQGEVWDILNCGPLHRFTANGLLVHNCILDHSGVVIRLGFPWDNFSRPLCQKKPGESSSKDKEQIEPLPKKCPKCSFVKPPKTPVCPECGFEATKPCDIECTDGNLVPLTEVKETKAIRTLKGMGRPSVYAQLLRVADIHKWSEGWAAHKYKVIFGQWPNRQSKTREDPTPEVLAWVRSQQIRFIKGKAKANG